MKACWYLRYLSDVERTRQTVDTARHTSEQLADVDLPDVAGDEYLEPGDGAEEHADDDGSTAAVHVDEPGGEVRAEHGAESGERAEPGCLLVRDRQPGVRLLQLRDGGRRPGVVGAGRH